MRRSIDVWSEGNRLDIERVSIEGGADRSCEVRLEARDEGDAIDVSGAR